MNDNEVEGSMIACTLFVVGFLVICAIVCACEWWKSLEFKNRFPPISDAEFVQRCGPGTNPAIALKVRRIVSDSLGVDYERIYPSTRFEDLGID